MNAKYPHAIVAQSEPDDDGWIEITSLSESLPEDFYRLNPQDLQGPLTDDLVFELIDMGGEQSYQRLVGALTDPSIDEDLKQHILANIDPLFESETNGIMLLHRIIADENAGNDLRVDALRKLSDYDFSQLDAYRGHDNAEISAEIDLLDRIRLHEFRSR